MAPPVGGRPKSGVWIHYDTLVIEGKTFHMCVHCETKKFAEKTPVGRLVAHVIVCPQSTPEEVDHALKLQHASEQRAGRRHDSEVVLFSESDGGSQSQPTLEATVGTTLPEKKTEIDERIAAFWFANGLPFSLADDVFWRKLVTCLRPSYTPPCAQTLRSTFLKLFASRASEATVSAISEAEVVCLTIDGWKNVRSDRILNVVVCSPTPILWTSLEVGAEEESGEYIAEKLLACVRDVETKTKAHVASIVTDNAPNMQKAWRLVKVSRPKMLTFGCVAHTLNLFIKDCCRDVPLLRDAVAAATQIVALIHSSPKLLAQFRDVQKRCYGKTMALYLPGRTRWLSVSANMGSVVRSRRALQLLADEQFKAIVNSTGFWQACKVFAPILRSCALAIMHLESDSATICQAFDAMVKTGCEIEKLAAPLRGTVMSLFRERFKFVYCSALTTASVLHPMAKSTPAAVQVAKSFLQRRYEGNGRLLNELLKELDEFLEHRGSYADPALWTEELVQQPRMWWFSRPPSPLRTVALGLYSTPSTSAGVERSFKSLGIVQSKIRNRLANDAASELAKIKAHLRSKCPIRFVTRCPLVDFKEPEVLQLPPADLSPPAMTTEEEEAEGELIDYLDHISLDGDEYFGEDMEDQGACDYDADHLTVFADLIRSDEDEAAAEFVQSQPQDPPDRSWEADIWA